MYPVAIECNSLYILAPVCFLVSEINTINENNLGRKGFISRFSLINPQSREVRLGIQDRNLEAKTTKYLCLLTPPTPGFIQFQTILFFSSIRLDYVFSIVSSSAFFLIWQ